ncbi:hypothetical protein C0993_008576 [Termitomyces sp. T159_Od127]|nr:hypothetical protein C0993_008576 [Termitomyces sp. T159_Od127]
MALRYTCHTLNAANLTVQLHNNFDARYQNPETGEPIMATARIPNMISGYLIAEARFANNGIHNVLQTMRLVLSERYTDPERYFSVYEEKERTEAQAKKESALKTLEDPRWLPNLLSTCLQDERIDWKTNAERVKQILAKFSNKFGPIGVKRKTESSLHSEGSRKASRRSGKSTPRDNRSALHETDLLNSADHTLPCKHRNGAVLQNSHNDVVLLDELKRLNERLEEASNTEGESEISDALEARAKVLNLALDKTPSTAARPAPPHPAPIQTRRRAPLRRPLHLLLFYNDFVALRGLRASRAVPERHPPGRCPAQ